MFKSGILVAAAAILALGTTSRPVPTSGSWQIDHRHSDAQLITDATTNYAKTNIDTTLGFARVTGVIRFDDRDAAKSTVDLEIYPAASMMPPINEDGALLDQWFANLANNTLICFHPKGIFQRPDGRLQTGVI